jgi:hypothetical protein
MIFGALHQFYTSEGKCCGMVTKDDPDNGDSRDYFCTHVLYPLVEMLVCEFL